MNPVSRFIYWNMNYHVEHHMFPMVPYHALPLLHDEMRADTPPPYPGQWVALKEVAHAVWRQRTDPEFSVRRDLPARSAAPEAMPQPG
jgi:fatty acid desaturase